MHHAHYRVLCEKLASQHENAIAGSTAWRVAQAAQYLVFALSDLSTGGRIEFLFKAAGHIEVLRATTRYSEWGEVEWNIPRLMSVYLELKDQLLCPLKREHTHLPTDLDSPFERKK